eukprot:TRINITY_DN1354_c0_g2_i1.p1 TRINITY_DN1354_c0_g2~~TRINITY_DN1354_c0_g2_i1.p1  ORF type:complete len:1554 (+),score=587.75 TRINITY_DN1354_c0_g2_i1:368-4663(+)
MVSKGSRRRSIAMGEQPKCLAISIPSIPLVDQNASQAFDSICLFLFAESWEDNNSTEATIDDTNANENADSNKLNVNLVQQQQQRPSSRRRRRSSLVPWRMNPQEVKKIEEKLASSRTDQYKKDNDNYKRMKMVLDRTKTILRVEMRHLRQSVNRLIQRLAQEAELEKLPQAPQNDLDRARRALIEVTHGKAPSAGRRFSAITSSSTKGSSSTISQQDFDSLVARRRSIVGGQGSHIQQKQQRLANANDDDLSSSSDDDDDDVTSSLMAYRKEMSAKSIERKMYEWRQALAERLKKIKDIGKRYDDMSLLEEALNVRTIYKASQKDRVLFDTLNFPAQHGVSTFLSIPEQVAKSQNLARGTWGNLVHSLPEVLEHPHSTKPAAPFSNNGKIYSPNATPEVVPGYFDSRLFVLVRRDDILSLLGQEGESMMKAGLHADIAKLLIPKLSLKMVPVFADNNDSNYDSVFDLSASNSTTGAYLLHHPKPGLSALGNGDSLSLSRLNQDAYQMQLKHYFTFNANHIVGLPHLNVPPRFNDPHTIPDPDQLDLNALPPHVVAHVKKMDMSLTGADEENSSTLWDWKKIRQIADRQTVSSTRSSKPRGQYHRLRLEVESKILRRFGPISGRPACVEMNIEQRPAQQVLAEMGKKSGDLGSTAKALTLQNSIKPNHFVSIHCLLLDGNLSLRVRLSEERLTNLLRLPPLSENEKCILIQVNDIVERLEGIIPFSTSPNFIKAVTSFVDHDDIASTLINTLSRAISQPTSVSSPFEHLRDDMGVKAMKSLSMRKALCRILYKRLIVLRRCGSYRLCLDDEDWLQSRLSVYKTLVIHWTKLLLDEKNTKLMEAVHKSGKTIIESVMDSANLPSTSLSINDLSTKLNGHRALQRVMDNVRVALFVESDEELSRNNGLNLLNMMNKIVQPIKKQSLAIIQKRWKEVIPASSPIVIRPYSQERCHYDVHPDLISKAAVLWDRCQIAFFAARVERIRSIQTLLRESVEHWGGMVQEDCISAKFRPYLTLSTQEEKEILNVFHQFDYDKSGSIEANELQAFLFDLGFVVEEEDVQTCFQNMDLDDNGHVDPYEFVIWWTLWRYDNDEHLRGMKNAVLAKRLRAKKLAKRTKRVVANFAAKPASAVKKVLNVPVQGGTKALKAIKKKRREMVQRKLEAREEKAAEQARIEEQKSEEDAEKLRRAALLARLNARRGKELEISEAKRAKERQAAAAARAKREREEQKANGETAEPPKDAAGRAAAMAQALDDEEAAAEEAKKAEMDLIREKLAKQAAKDKAADEIKKKAEEEKKAYLEKELANRERELKQMQQEERDTRRYVEESYKREIETLREMSEEAANQREAEKQKQIDDARKAAEAVKERERLEAIKQADEERERKAKEIEERKAKLAARKKAEAEKKAAEEEAAEKERQKRMDRRNRRAARNR